MKIKITESQLNKLNKINNKVEVFLGGTCNGSNWRDKLIPKLKISYFNPVVDNWTPADAKKEIEKRKSCDYCLYIITPKIKGFLSIGEVVEDSIKSPDKTIFCFLTKDDSLEFDEAQLKSLEALSKMIENNGAKVFNSLDDVSKYLNKD